MITDLHHVSLFVADLDRSLAFYCGTLGFELVSRDEDRRGAFLDQVCGVEGIALRLALVRGGGEVIELIQVVSPPGHQVDGPGSPAGWGVARLGFQVEGIEALVERLRAAGVEFLSEVAVVSSGHYAGGKAVFFRDPDGILLELQEPDRPGRIT